MKQCLEAIIVAPSSLDRHRLGPSLRLQVANPAGVCPKIADHLAHYSPVDP